MPNDGANFRAMGRVSKTIALHRGASSPSRVGPRVKGVQRLLLYQGVVLRKGAHEQPSAAAG
eukprot:12242761-Alexandrium_andersonii.AAC.1